MSLPELDGTGREIRDRAAEWLALRQARGLTLNEEADFADWLAADPRHAAHFTELESAWKTFDRLGSWPHSADLPPDPDLLKRPAVRRRIAWQLPLAAAAAVTIAAVTWFRPWVAPETALPPVVAETVPSPLMRLPDGSVVELNGRAEVREEFTPGERRVRLVHGEAHFIVAKNKERPFIVEANGVAVRAVGTAFNVRLGESSVEVLVTEGTVQVAPPAPTSDESPAGSIATLTIGQHTVVPTSVVAALEPPVVDTLPMAEIDRKLAWQRSRFAFEEMSLAEVVGRFNRQAVGRPDAPRLVIGDPRLAALRISGRVRVDNIESFVEVLETSFGVQADRSRPGEIVLRPANSR